MFVCTIVRYIQNQNKKLYMHQYGILGYGFVGMATHKGLLDNCNIAVHDIKNKTEISALKDCDVVFCCLPTNDHRDVNILIDELKNLQSVNRSFLIVIRSTVPVGTCARIEQELGTSILYIPEFLRERFWETDCLKRPVIVGNDSAILPEFLDNIEIKVCSLSEAELVKMFSNNYATMRIAFANILFDLSQKQNADYHIVKELFFQTQHDQTYMEVPGHDGKRGFGGKCLPKDLDFLIGTLDEYQIDSKLFRYIKENNEVWNGKEY